MHYYERRKARNVKLLAYYLNVKDLKKTAKAFGIGQQATRDALKKMGQTFSKKKLREGACVKNKALVLHLVEDGYSLVSIGRRIGTTGRSVRRFLRYAGIDKEFPVGVRKEKHPNWKGGKIVDKDGYVLVYCPEHPHRRKLAPYVLEHRLVMEQMIGRLLLPEEVVHHRDKNKQNNSPENLQLFSENAAHLAHELKGRVPNWTPAGIERMRKGIVRSSRQRRGQNLGLSAPDAVQWPQKKNHPKVLPDRGLPRPL